MPDRRCVSLSAAVGPSSLFGNPQSCFADIPANALDVSFGLQTAGGQAMEVYGATCLPPFAPADGGSRVGSCPTGYALCTESPPVLTSAKTALVAGGAAEGEIQLKQGAKVSMHPFTLTGRSRK